MITIVVAKLMCVVAARDSDAVFLGPQDLPVTDNPNHPNLRSLIESLQDMLHDEIRLVVLFPGGWAGKKPSSEQVEERVSNFLTMCQDSAIVVAGAMACSFFDKRLYKNYLGTGCFDYGVGLFPAPHPEDLLNSNNVMLGDLVLAASKVSKHGQSSDGNAGRNSPGA